MQIPCLHNFTNGTTYGEAFDLVFTATGSSVTLTDAGYNPPSVTYVAYNSVVANGDTANVLGTVRNLTPAPAGSFALQAQYFSSGEVNDLAFLGVVAGS